MKNVNEIMPGPDVVDDGEVYLLKNEAMPGFYKIGLSRSGVESRLKTLNNTSVPFSFECIYKEKTRHCLQLENHVHGFLADKRLNDKREFFVFTSDDVAIQFVVHAISKFTPKNYTQRERMQLRAAKTGGPSQFCKDLGLRGLSQVSEMSGVSSQTLINWHRSKPNLFEVVVFGCVSRSQQIDEG